MQIPATGPIRGRKRLTSLSFSIRTSRQSISKFTLPVLTLGDAQLRRIQVRTFTYTTLVWSPGTLVWKIDGVITQTVTNSYVPSHPMYLIINLAMGGSGGGGVNNATLPSSTVVEYVKITQP